jgi:chromosome segregation ATPase
MDKRNASSLFKLIVVIFFTLGTAHLASGQTNKQPDDKETLRALLTEVTLLRQSLQTLQRMSLDTYRSQLLVDRIRVNREDVRRLAVSLNETRDMISKTQIQIPRTLDEQKLLEGQVPLEVDANKRATLEFELKRAREAGEMYKAQLERLRQREQEVSSDLRAEQTKLDELEGRLDLLERAIENDRQRLEAEKPAPDKKPQL